MRGPTAAVLVALVACCASSGAPAMGWGLNGHTMIGEAAVAHLPDGLPDFMKTAAAKDEIVYLQDEEDRLKIGESDESAWTREWTTDHYIDIGDDGTVDGVAISALPETRDDFIQALGRENPPVDAYNVGFLPYAILEGYEQVRSDFALWRQSTSAADKAERESLTLHDIGIFAHFVGDGSQPLHVSVHYNGWGKYPNPNGHTVSKDTHEAFESTFVDKFVTLSDVQPLVGPARTLEAIPLGDIETYLLATDAQVVPLYELEKAGGFALSDSTSAVHRKAVQFAAQRMAAASQMLDSLILTAWQTSATMKGGD